MKMHYGILVLACLLTSFVAVQADEHRIGPGQSVQAALDKLAPGDTLVLMPGVYRQTVSIKTEHIAFIGTESGGERAVFDGSVKDEEMPDFAIRIDADNVSVKGLEIRNYKTGAVLAYNHDNISISDLSTSNTGMFGILSGKASNLSVSRCVLRDASDTAMAMDLVRGANLQALELYQNAIGLGVFDCADVSLSDSSIHHNTVGIALEDKGDKEVESDRVFISRCRIVGNGTSQFEGDKPMHGYRGVGLYIQGFSHVDVSNCFFDLNATQGIMVVKLDHKSGKVLSNELRLHKNTYHENGNDPSGQFTAAYQVVPGGDIFWDRTGAGNRFMDSGALKTSPRNLPK